MIAFQPLFVRHDSFPKVIWFYSAAYPFPDIHCT
jgi:hypothetical protein